MRSCHRRDHQRVTAPAMNKKVVTQFTEKAFEILLD